MSTIDVRRDVLGDNDRAAAENRDRFKKAGVYVVNLMSAPGAGKTTVIERMAEVLPDRCRMGVIAGDIETRRDADRIAKYGIPVHALNTGGACHLEARLIGKALETFDLDALDVLLIENVGNLVCPAEFDLGEDDKAMILSVTEGHDKPAKYPLMFQEARALILNKVDLLPYTEFDEEAALKDVRALNPDIRVIRMSARTGEGMDAWIEWLLSQRAAVVGGR